MKLQNGKPTTFSVNWRFPSTTQPVGHTFRLNYSTVGFHFWDQRRPVPYPLLETGKDIPPTYCRAPKGSPEGEGPSSYPRSVDVGRSRRRTWVTPRHSSTGLRGPKGPRRLPKLFLRTTRGPVPPPRSLIKVKTFKCNPESWNLLSTFKSFLIRRRFRNTLST